VDLDLIFESLLAVLLKVVDMPLDGVLGVVPLSSVVVVVHLLTTVVNALPHQALGNCWI
jgi:hypothetical protein